MSFELILGRSLDLKLILFLRSFLGLLIFLMSTLINAIVCIVGVSLRAPKSFVDLILQKTWPLPYLWSVGVRVRVKGLDQLPESGGYLIVFNHRSFLDIPALFVGLPKAPRFGAKAELFSIPLFSQAMKASGMLPIERQKRSEVLRVYEKSYGRAQAGEVFALAPEGSRSKPGILRPFKRGPFLFAIGAQVPVVPVAIRGADQVLPMGATFMNPRKWIQEIELTCLAPLSTSGLDSSNAAQLALQARSQIQQILGEQKNEGGRPHLQNLKEKS